MKRHGFVRLLLAAVILFSVGGCEQVHTCTAIGTVRPDGQKPPECP